MEFVTLNEPKLLFICFKYMYYYSLSNQYPMNEPSGSLSVIFESSHEGYGDSGRYCSPLVTEPPSGESFTSQKSKIMNIDESVASSLPVVKRVNFCLYISD